MQLHPEKLYKLSLRVLWLSHMVCIHGSKSTASLGDTSRKKYYCIGSNNQNCSLAKLKSSRDLIKFILNIVIEVWMFLHQATICNCYLQVTLKIVPQRKTWTKFISQIKNKHYFVKHYVTPHNSNYCYTQIGKRVYLRLLTQSYPHRISPEEHI